MHLGPRATGRTCDNARRPLISWSCARSRFQEQLHAHREATSDVDINKYIKKPTVICSRAANRTSFKMPLSEHCFFVLYFILFFLRPVFCFQQLQRMLRAESREALGGSLKTFKTHSSSTCGRLMLRCLRASAPDLRATIHNCCAASLRSVRVGHRRL